MLTSNGPIRHMKEADELFERGRARLSRTLWPRPRGVVRRVGYLSCGSNGGRSGGSSAMPGVGETEMRKSSAFRDSASRWASFIEGRGFDFRARAALLPAGFWRGRWAVRLVF